MKIDTQYRWLLFLLIPLIVCMIVLVALSVSFVLFSKIFSTHSYNLATNMNSQKLLQSQGQLISLKINSILNKYNQVLNYFDGMNGHTNYYHVSNLTINNGLQFYDRYQQTKKEQYQSMWFTERKRFISQMNQIQYQSYLKYLKKQPLIQVTFNQFFKDQKNFVVGLYTVYKINGTTLNFYYPSIRLQIPEHQDSNLTYPLFEFVTQNYRNTNNTFFFIEGTFGFNITSYCKLLFDQESNPAGVSCLDFTVKEFMTFLNADLNNIKVSFNDFNFLFVTPHYQNIQNISIINAISDEQYTTDQLFYTFLPLVGQDIKPQNFHTYQLGIERFMIYPIQLYDHFTKKSNVILYMVIEVDLQNTDNVDVNVLIKAVINAVIPITILLLITLIASFILLKCLLDDLDVELSKVNECCQFILHGDIQIQIPIYKGSADIVQIYRYTSIINKLNKYSSNDYFVGHNYAKIIKYSQALNLLEQLQHDPNYIMQNIGDAYRFNEEYEKSIEFLKKSVLAMQKIIRHKYHVTLDRMFQMKEKKQRLSTQYKEDELVLIRRLWKLIYSSFRYIAIENIEESAKLSEDSMIETEKAHKKRLVLQQLPQFITKYKMAIYPDFKAFAETIWILNFQIKVNINSRKYGQAWQTLNRCQHLVLAYAKQYEANSRRLKEKGSKNLYFYRKNKLSSLSRCNPHIVIAYTEYSKALLLLSDPENKDYYEAYCILVEALKTHVYSKTVNYLIISEIKNILATLGIGLEKLQTTQLFHQSMPYKCLHYGDEAIYHSQQSLYRFPRIAHEVESREYVIFVDTSHLFVGESESRLQKRHLKERIEHLYEKLVKPHDRISIVKSNSQIGLQTICNLLSVQHSSQLLKKSLKDLIKHTEFLGKNDLCRSIEKIFTRIRRLRSHKVICVYLKNIESYVSQFEHQGKLKNKKKLMKRFSIVLMEKQNQKITNCYSNINLHIIGQIIESLMKNVELRNCKLILIGSAKDRREAIVSFFGLKGINRRIFNGQNGCNVNNNSVYVIEDKNKVDLDRVLMSKITVVSDNHVFIL